MGEVNTQEEVLQELKKFLGDKLALDFFELCYASEEKLKEGMNINFTFVSDNTNSDFSHIGFDITFKQISEYSGEAISKITIHSLDNVKVIHTLKASSGVSPYPNKHLSDLLICAIKNAVYHYLEHEGNNETPYEYIDVWIIN